MERIIECVPNFSEGRNMEVINTIVATIEKSGGVKVLDVDPGEATNRTVVTFVGSPEDVVEAAFQGVRKAGELIDMRQHHGAHPRSGATDVLPLIPISGITLQECAELARQLAARIYNELEIPCYCYEAAAQKPERKNLAVCRAGEYEALPEKMSDPDRQPDFGPGCYTDRAAQAGATNVGALDFLIAVNYNLNTTSTRRANAIAFDVREKGRPKREGNPITGKIVKDENGKTVMIPGTLKGCKAIGWFIDEYGIAQVSMNITDINTTPLHVAFDEVCRAAQARGLRVTGTEIVGLVPKRTLIEAGRYFLEKQQRSTGISEEEIMKIAVKSMGLDDLKPFNPKEKVVEFLIEDEKEVAARNQKIQQTENKLKQREISLNQKQEELQRKKNETEAVKENLEAQLVVVDRKKEELDNLQAQEREKLEAISGLTVEEAKERLIESLKEEAKTEAASYINDIMDDAKLTASKEAKRIVIQSIQRVATETAIENSVTVFHIDSDEIKGRIIGREGRNIRALEAVKDFLDAAARHSFVIEAVGYELEWS